MQDAALLERLRRRDPDALDALTARYRPYVRAVFAHILRELGTREDLEELCADVFVTLWQHAGEPEPEQLKAWLGTVARNRAKNWLRQRRELPMDPDSLELALPAGSPGLEDQLIRAELAAAVRRAVDSLRPRDREIFLRYYFYLQPVQTIARELGLAPASVRSRLSRGREKLRKKLEKEVRA